MYDWHIVLQSVIQNTYNVFQQDSWTRIGRDFSRLFLHLFGIEEFTKYWALIDNDSNSSKLVQILDVSTNPLILQICINKQEQLDLIKLCNDITVCFSIFFLN